MIILLNYTIKKEVENRYLIIIVFEICTNNLTKFKGSNNKAYISIEEIEKYNTLTVFLYGIAVLILFVASFLVYLFIYL